MISGKYNVMCVFVSLLSLGNNILQTMSLSYIHRKMYILFRHSKASKDIHLYPEGHV